MSERFIDKPIKTTIDRCARCNGTHQDLVFKPFRMHNPYYGHWAPCPNNNGDPILLKVEIDDNGS